MMMIIPQEEVLERVADCKHSTTTTNSENENEDSAQQQQQQKEKKTSSGQQQRQQRQFYYKSDYEDGAPITTRTDFHGVKVRAWSRRSSTTKDTTSSIPCLLPGDNGNGNSTNGHGLVFIKPLKTGSSTAAGVNLRIAYNEASRRKQQQQGKQDIIISNDDTSPSIYPPKCKSYWEHQWASTIFKDDFEAVDHGTSDNKNNHGITGSSGSTTSVSIDTTNNTYLWSVIRDPTSRLVSQFFHFQVSRGKKEPTDEEFISHVRNKNNDGYKHSRRDHYVHWLSTKTLQVRPPRPKSQKKIKRYNSNFASTNSYYINVLNQIMNDYDFIGVTERMDESLVALSMLMNVPLSDVLYLQAKGHGSWDDGGAINPHTGNYWCVYIMPSFISNGMYEYFTTEEFQDIVYYDHILHQVVNASLDYTIDTVLGGREGVFDKELQRYQRALQLVKDKCLEKTIFPCSQTGENDGQRKHVDQTDCLESDSGCGHDCINQVARVYLK